jgi:oxygen-independent coproporphyrinogen-3 oxidase
MTEKHPETWLARVEADGHALVTEDVLAPEECADEMLLMGLRLREGVSARRYEAMSGRAIDPSRVEFLRSHGLVEETGGGYLRATPQGWLVLDSVVADLAA